MSRLTQIVLPVLAVLFFLIVGICALADEMWAPVVLSGVLVYCAIRDIFRARSNGKDAG